MTDDDPTAAEPIELAATIQERLVGRVADLLVHVVIGIVVTLPAQGDLDAGQFSLWAMGAAVVMFVWETAWVALTGASVGKHLAGTRVFPSRASVDVASAAAVGLPGLGRSALRATPRLLWGFPLGVVAAAPLGAISLLLLLTTAQRRTLADLLAGTVVVTVVPTADT